MISHQQFWFKGQCEVFISPNTGVPNVNQLVYTEMRTRISFYSYRDQCYQRPTGKRPKVRATAAWQGVKLPLKLSVCSLYFNSDSTGGSALSSIVWTQFRTFFHLNWMILFIHDPSSLFVLRSSRRSRSIFNSHRWTLSNVDMLRCNEFGFWRSWNVLLSCVTWFPEFGISCSYHSVLAYVFHFHTFFMSDASVHWC